MPKTSNRHSFGEDTTHANCTYCRASIEEWGRGSFKVCDTCKRPLWLHWSATKEGFRRVFSVIDGLRFLVAFHAIIWWGAILITGGKLTSITALVAFVLIPFGLLDIANGAIGFGTSVQRKFNAKLARGREAKLLSLFHIGWGALPVIIGCVILSHNF